MTIQAHAIRVCLDGPASFSPAAESPLIFDNNSSARRDEEPTLCGSLFQQIQRLFLRERSRLCKDQASSQALLPVHKLWPAAFEPALTRTELLFSRDGLMRRLPGGAFHSLRRQHLLFCRLCQYWEGLTGSEKKPLNIFLSTTVPAKHRCATFVTMRDWTGRLGNLAYSVASVQYLRVSQGCPLTQSPRARRTGLLYCHFG